MLPMRSSPHAGFHFTFLIAASAFSRSVPAVDHAVHADEPLLGGAEDGRIVTPPAMRITVLDLARRRQRAHALQNLDDDRVAFPDGLAQ
jgi:hypothetical protein